jgi:hypothetical protein
VSATSQWPKFRNNRVRTIKFLARAAIAAATISSSLAAPGAALATPSKLLCYKLEGKPAPYACIRVSNTTPARGETVVVRGVFSEAARADLAAYLNAWPGNAERAQPGEATVCLFNNGRQSGRCQELTSNGRFRFKYAVPERAPNEATVGRDVITVQVSAPNCTLQANCPPDVIPLTRAIDLKIT